MAVRVQLYSILARMRKDYVPCVEVDLTNRSRFWKFALRLHLKQRLQFFIDID
jgi:hypothetical protein